MSWTKRTLLATVSAAATWPLSDLWEAVAEFGAGILFLMIGALFGALVLAPFAIRDRRHNVRVAGLVLGSVVIYELVTALAVARYGPLQLTYDLSTVISGVVGAFLVAWLLEAVAPVQTSIRYWAYVAIAGLFGGLMCNLLWESDEGALFALGYFAWQVPVSLALHFGTATRRSDVPTPVVPT